MSILDKVSEKKGESSGCNTPSLPNKISKFVSTDASDAQVSEQAPGENECLSIKLAIRWKT